MNLAHNTSFDNEFATHYFFMFRRALPSAFFSLLFVCLVIVSQFYIHSVVANIQTHALPHTMERHFMLCPLIWPDNNNFPTKHTIKSTPKQIRLVIIVSLGFWLIERMNVLELVARCKNAIHKLCVYFRNLITLILLFSFCGLFISNPINFDWMQFSSSDYLTVAAAVTKQQQQFIINTLTQFIYTLIRTSSRFGRRIIWQYRYFHWYCTTKCHCIEFSPECLSTFPKSWTDSLFLSVCVFLFRYVSL